MGSDDISSSLKDIHKGHRQRLKERFLCDGINGFEHHNALELLLFYGIPRMDTNVIAHNLINTFGSISAVFDAPFEELIKVNMVSENAATLIKLIPSLARVYAVNMHSDTRVFDTPEVIGEYFIGKFIGCTNEMVYLMLLDSSLQLISCELVSSGSVTAAGVNIRTIVDLVVKHNACAVVMAHNHPRGLAVPSAEDLAVTSKVRLGLKTLDIRFVEHIIVAQNDYVALIASGFVAM